VEDCSIGKDKKKAEGRRQKAEGRRQKAEGRRQKAEGRRQKKLGMQDRKVISKIASYSPFTTDHSPQKISGVKASLNNHTTYCLHQLPGII
jgi:uncharacterized protein YjbJ (UPF0337 family)